MALRSHIAVLGNILGYRQRIEIYPFTYEQFAGRCESLARQLYIYSSIWILPLSSQIARAWFI